MYAVTLWTGLFSPAAQSDSWTTRLDNWTFIDQPNNSQQLTEGVANTAKSYFTYTFKHQVIKGFLVA
jgi:hypothetical protein